MISFLSKKLVKFITKQMRKNYKYMHMRQYYKSNFASIEQNMEKINQKLSDIKRNIHK